MQQGQQQDLARAAFQAGKESRKRKREWEELRPMLLRPPAGTMTYAQIERRRELVERWDWLRYPDEVRRRAVTASRQGGEALQKIEDRQRELRESIRLREIEAREAREQLGTVKTYQIFEKTRRTRELQAAEKALALAEAEQKHLDRAEKKLLNSCPPEVVLSYLHDREKEREKAVVQLQHQEWAEEEEAERQREEEAERRRTEPPRPAVTKSQKPNGWTPPSPG